MYYWTVKIMKPRNFTVAGFWVPLVPAIETYGHLKVNAGLWNRSFRKILWSFTTHITYWSVVIYVIVIISLQIEIICPLKW